MYQQILIHAPRKETRVCVERPKSPDVLSSGSDWLFMAKGDV